MWCGSAICLHFSVSMMGGSRNATRTDGMDVQVQAVCEKILSSSAFMEKIVNNISERLLACMDERLKEYSNKVSSLEEKFEFAMSKIDDLEQKARSRTLRVYGLVSRSLPQAIEEISMVCSSKLNIKVTSQDIENSYFLKQPKNRNGALIVNFTSERLRNNIYSNKSKFKGTKVVVKEDLAPSRYKLYVEAGRIYGVTNVWTSYGKIMVKDGDNVVRKLQKLGDIKYPS